MITNQKVIDNEKKMLIVIIVVMALFLIGPYFFRVANGNPYMINSESYNFLRLINSGSPTVDSIQGEHHSISILNFLSIHINILTSKIISIALGLLSLLFAYSLFKQHNFGQNNITAIMLIMVSSPIFIYSFIDLKIYTIIFFLSILAAYLYSKTRIISYISYVIILLLPFINLEAGLMAIVILAIYFISAYKTHQIKNILIVSLASIIISILANWLIGEIQILHMSKANFLADIGSTLGISFSVLVLAFIGIILLWDKSVKNLAIYALIIGLFILSIYNNTARIYMNFVISVYAGFAFTYLNRRKWSIHIIKKITILLIICSILFTSLVYSSRLINSSPNPEYIEALIFTKKQSLPSEQILTNPENTDIINYYTEIKIYSNDQLLLKSRNLEFTEKILHANNIKYIFIDKQFMETLKEKEGLLFLIENSGKFKSIYKNKEVDVWYYLG